MEEFINTALDNLHWIAIALIAFYVINLLHGILATLKNMRRIYANKNDIDIGED